MQKMLSNRIGLSLETLSIYLAYVVENNLPFNIIELRDIRQELYFKNFNMVYYVLNNYSKIIKNNNMITKPCSNKKVENDFTKMLDNSRKYLINEMRTAETPIAILTGGQQGSGKTNLILSSLEKFKRNSVAILDLDAYRGFYKNCFSLMKSCPNHYAEIINKDAGKIMEVLTMELINKKYNFIFEGTLGKSAYTLDLLLDSKIEYRIIIKIMAVCREESLLSIFERYLESYKECGIGRLTTIKSHDATYYKFTERIKNISEKNIIIEVYCKSRESFKPVLIYKTGSKNNLNENAYDALVYGRNKSYNEYQKSFSERLTNINKQAIKIKENKELLDEVMKLNHIFKEQFKE